ncbi:hypothetical protein D3H55_16165 [Bacillus salacetis]|uniref:YheC/YheD family protein n=1 Tax=Bacillus salacetis TaxID=2315464 RepID=A0A3A1QUR1_9BACI|nr:YheC/YheD family protein [Bacillus salacetis]RIW30919.1 hypothetical protein D3H55_16165 [Bacillus salacetis]
MRFKFKASSSINEPILYLSNSSIPELNAFFGERISLRIGLSRFQIKLAVSSSKQECCELLFPGEHANKLEWEGRFQYYFSSEGKTLSLGPVIGILTDIDKTGKPLLGRLDGYYSELHRFTQLQGGLFFLTGSAELKRSQGYLFNEEKGNWIQTFTPLPDILYNRIHSRKSDRDERIKNLISSLKNESVFVFNTSYLTKEYVHSLLSQEDHLLEYLPSTETFSTSRLRSMIEQHRDLFIKHVAGSQGKKLMRLTLLDDEYRLSQNLLDETVSKTFYSFSEAADEFSKQKVSSNYILQETIPLLKAGTRALDFRFLCHLVHRKEWKLISAVARISGEGQFVSNIAKGGELAKPLNILNEFFSLEEARRIFLLMEELALSVCSSLAKNSSLTLGELGIDLGVDESGKPWLIEVNSKPSKQTYTDNNTIRPSVKALQSLAGTIWEERRI